MDLRTDYPYWLLRHGIIHSYPSLRHDTRADIVIIGGGISGALTAWYLSREGFDTLLVDRRHIGMGSTAASTSLLQYEIDTPLCELVKKVGEKNAVKSYHLCREAIDTLGNIFDALKIRDNFKKKPSFQFASYKKDRKKLEAEFLLRKSKGFSLQWMDEKDILDRYGFYASGGILSNDGADADVYQLTHALLRANMAGGLAVYDHTGIVNIRHGKRKTELVTGDGIKIRARKLIIACGYESQRYIPRQVQDLRSTYVIASEPQEQKELWYKNSLIWETKNPYLYLRTTPDNRIIVGGKDIASSDPVKRDKLLHAKARSLEHSFTHLFPSIPFRTDFKWAGSFASTKDGLPYIGCLPGTPNAYFALGFGGNGITFSVIAAQLIRDMIKGRKNNDVEIFSFNR